MRWANFLSQFNFNIAQIANKHNQVDDALSQRPRVNAVSIATHKDLSQMKNEYAFDLDIKELMFKLALGNKQESYDVKDNYLLFGNRLCVPHEYA